MSETYLLLADLEQQQATLEAIVLDKSRADAMGEGVEVSFIPSRKDALFQTAVQAGTHSWRLLHAEGRLMHRWRLYYRAPQHQSVGPSTGLAYFLQQMRLAYAGDAVLAAPIAATGALPELDQGEAIGRIGEVVLKVAAARRALVDQPGALVLIPAANRQEIAEHDPSWLDESATPRLIAVATLTEALDAIGIQLERTYLNEAGPYRGLEAFDVAHRSLFFGREAQVEQVLSQLKATAQPIPTLILGPSGSGKSSFLRAGILARLLYPPLGQQLGKHRDGQPRHYPRSVFIHPANGQVECLGIWRPSDAGNLDEASLSRSLQHHWQRLLPEASLNGDSLDSLFQSLAPHLDRKHSGHDWYFAIDQMEELLRDHSQRPEIEHGLSQLGRFLQQLRDAGVWLLATLRDDDFGRLRRQRELKDLFDNADHWCELDSLKDLALHSIISEPAQRAGIQLEDGLITQLLQDVQGNDALPLLEFTLRELYKLARSRKQTTGSTQPPSLQLADYAQLNGLIGAITQRAEQRLSGLESESRERTLGALARLARLENDDQHPGQLRYLRQRVQWHDFSAHERELLKPWIEERLLIKSGQGDQQSTLEVAHEALLRHFEPLSDWLAQHQEDLGWRQRYLLPRYQDKVYLSGHDLQAAERLLQQDSLLSPGEADFVRQSLELQRQRDEAQRAEEEQRLQEQLAREQALREEAEQERRYAEVAKSRAEYERGQADAQRNRAEKLAMRSMALNLATQCSYDLKSNISSAGILKAILAFRLAPQEGAIVDALQMVYAEIALKRFYLKSTVDFKGVSKFLAISPDGELLVSERYDNSLSIWSVKTGRLVGKPLKGNSHRIICAAFSPDGKKLVSGGEGKYLVFWCLKEGSGAGVELFGHKSAVQCIAFSPDGKGLVSGDESGVIIYWALDSDVVSMPSVMHSYIRQAYNTLHGFYILSALGYRKVGVTSLCFSPDGRYAVCGFSDGAIQVWDVHNRRKKSVHKCHGGEDVVQVSFSNNGRHVLTLPMLGNPALWRFSNGKIVFERYYDVDNCCDGLFNPNGSEIAFLKPGGNVCFVEVESGRFVSDLICSKPSLGLSDKSHELLFLNNKLLVLSGGRIDEWGVLLCEGRKNFDIKEDKEIFDVACSPDGRIVATVLSDHSVLFWDADSGVLIRVIHSHNKLDVIKVVFFPDGDFFLALGKGGLCKFQTCTGMAIWDYKYGGDCGVKCASFSRDGKLIVIASSDGVIILLDSRTGLPIGGSRYWFSEGVIDVAICPDGDKIIALSHHGVACVFDIASGILIGEKRQYYGFNPALTHDGLRCMVCSFEGGVQEWDIFTGNLISELNDGFGFLERFRYSPDGKYVSAISKNEVSLFHIPSRRRVWQYVFGDTISNVPDLFVFSLDGKRCVLVSPNGIFFTWFTHEGIVDQLCLLVDRNPTQRELADWGAEGMDLPTACPEYPTTKK